MKRKATGVARIDPYYLVCKICRAGFFSKKIDGKTCSPRCRKALQRKRDAVRAANPKIDGM